jgi:hypothetical protein
MNKRWKIIAVFAVIMLTVLSANVMAQNAISVDPEWTGYDDQATDGTSNTNRSTAGLYYEDRDNYLDTTGLAGLSKNLIFVNLFTNNYFGGNAVTGTSVNSHEVDPYFDAGTGFHLGANWIGLAFTYGTAENINEAEQSSRVTVLNADGSISTITDTENVTTITSQWNDWFRFHLVFGNKAWGLKNSFNLVNRKAEGYVAPNTGAIGGTTIAGGGINLVTVPAAATGNYPTAGAPGSTGTINPGGTVTKNTLTPGETLAGVVSDTLEFGIHLDEVVSSLSAYAPWAKVQLGFTYTDYTTTLALASGALTPAAFSYGRGGAAFNNAYASLKGYGWDYSLSDNLIGTQVAASYTHDRINAEGDLGIGLAGGADIKLNDLFTLSPEIGYGIDFSLYANKYTDVNGGEENIAGAAETWSGHSYVNSGWYYAANPANNGYRTSQSDTRVAQTRALSRVQQELAPALALYAEFPAVNFAIKYTPKLNFDWISQTYSFSNKTVIVEKYGSDASQSYTTTTNVSRPDRETEYKQVKWDSIFDIAAQLWLKKEKLRLNAGASFTNTFGDWRTYVYNSADNKVTTTVTKVYDDGHEDATTVPVTSITGNTETENQSFNNTVSPVVEYSLGATFFLSENVNFDFYFENQASQAVSWTEFLLPTTWGIQFNIRY